MTKQPDKDTRAALPTAKAEDVEFAPELADEDDREAKARAEAADRRAQRL